MNLLKRLYKIASPSGEEGGMRRVLICMAKKVGADVKVDEAGNVLVTKGEAESYPCVVAHMDQVNPVDDNVDWSVMEARKHVHMLFGYDHVGKTHVGLGADDKNGIWVALKCLYRQPAIKIAFFVNEEGGGTGSNSVDMGFFDDVRFVVQCDRRGSSDFITSIGGVVLCDYRFYGMTGADRFGYKVEAGLFTDVLNLKMRGLRVNCCNLSCGYYQPHTDSEYTIYGELLNCLKLVTHIIETVTEPSMTDCQSVCDRWKEYDMVKAFGDRDVYVNECDDFEIVYTVGEDLLQMYPDLSEGEFIEMMTGKLVDKVGADCLGDDFLKGVYQDLRALSARWLDDYEFNY